MELTNKDYLKKGTRWYWYLIFFIILNIVLPLIFEFLFIIEEEITFLFMGVFVLILILLSILFIRNIKKRESGFSVSLMIVISVIYFIYFIFLIYGFADMEYNETLSCFIILPIGIGPLCLLGNFIASHIMHKKNIVKADEKSKILLFFGIFSIIVSLFAPLILLVVIVCAFLFSGSIPSVNFKKYESNKAKMSKEDRIEELNKMLKNKKISQKKYEEEMKEVSESK